MIAYACPATRPVARWTITPARWVVLSLALLLGACSTGTSEEEFMKRGFERLAAEDLMGAQIEFKNALNENPDLVAARIALARVYLDLFAEDAAEKEVQRAIEIEGRTPRTSLLMARVSILRRHYDRAWTLINGITGTEPDEIVELETQRARLQILLRRYDDAENSLGRAAAVDPDHPDVVVTRARLAVARSNVDRAKSLLDASLQSRPDSLPLLLMRGRLPLHDLEPEAAVESFRAAIEVRDQSPEAHMGMASALLMLRDAEGAERHSARAGQLVPSSTLAAYLFAAARYQRGDLDEALAVLLRLTQVSPGHAQSRNLIALIHIKRG